jgi:amidophosphoribosyltransferase
MSGILGLNLSGDVFLEDIASAAGIMQPRGDEWGGIAIRRGGAIDRFASQGKITPLFAREHEQLSGARQFIVHVNQSPKNPQPAWIEETDMGPIALAFDGKIINTQEIKKRSPYLIGSEAGIMARLVGAASTPLEGIESVFNTIEGPFCLVLITKEGIYAARDTLGIRPLHLARSMGENAGCGVASESISLEHIGMELIRDVRPGEIVEIQPEGFKVLKTMPGAHLSICSFEYGYWARGSSQIEGVWVRDARCRAGKQLAKDCPQADLISSFPMSGNLTAEGLHLSTSIPYQSVYDYNIEAGGRSFLPFDSRIRRSRARNKLLPIVSAIAGRNIIMVDDSIVEGNQTRERIYKLRNAGAKEIYMGVETPPIKFPCPFDITPRGSLLAAKHSIEEMQKLLGLKKLWFNSVESFADSIISSQSEERLQEDPLKMENLCLGCFTGEFPKYGLRLF